MRRALFALFIVSGVAGLIYESIWTRYLGLFVGHDAYAQILVLVIFLGGMSAGAMIAGRRSARMKEPLYGYVAIEFAVGVIGLVFHDLFQSTTGFAYNTLLPALAGGTLGTVAKWGLASALILPQSVLLGATFPLMSAGVLRLSPGRPGRSLALLYFANSIGAAVGGPLAGFYLVNLAGLPGTLIVAAMLNLLVAGGTMVVIVRARNAAIDAGTSTVRPPVAAAAAAGVTATETTALRRLLLGAAFGTAVASFLYEIDWIRMLSLVLGSATHSFELMLAAFIFGLALGAYWIRGRIDRIRNPLRTLGIVQCAMGLLALATLPVYLHSFQWIASLLGTFARTDGGYTGFTLSRFAICLAVMLPATFCAGMTLPLITRLLLVRGDGERAIGTVYAWNTLGSIAGVVLGGLVLMPLVGLKTMLAIAAAIDIAIGIMLLRAADRATVRRRWPAMVAMAAGAAAVAAIFVATRLEPHVLVSGVYRSASVVDANAWEMRHYRDGRTATVAAFKIRSNGWLSISTNGKTDASLSPTWFERCDTVAPRRAMTADAATQALLPLVTLAHAPRARTAAVIGQGSGMSSHLLLGSAPLQHLVTVEIEPQMVTGSRVFLPANHRVFDDPRSEIVIDDAKSFFAASRQRYDLILSEPSNPWVSGVSGLFTAEFYTRVSRYLSDDGVFGQWLHVYQLDDALVLSVVAAIHRVFPSYEIFLVPSGDLLIVASNRPKLPTPDWSVVNQPALQRDLCRFQPLTPDALDALHLIGRAGLAPVLDNYGQPNSDYYPVLDLGAERRRFRGDRANGFVALSHTWFNFVQSFGGTVQSPGGPVVPALPENPRGLGRAMSTYLRSRASVADADTVTRGLLLQAAYRDDAWQAMLRRDQPPADWTLWVQQAIEVAYDRGAGTAGWADEPLYADMARFMDRHQAPAAARDAIAFRHALATWKFADAVAAADRLLPAAMADGRWISADDLRDGTVMAKLHVGEAAGARKYLDLLAPYSTRRPDDLRNRILESYVLTLEGIRPRVAGR